MPKDELEHFAEEFGLDPSDYQTRQNLVAAIHERRQLIAAMDREAMLDVVRWGRRPVAVNVSKEDLAQRDRPHQADAIRGTFAARIDRPGETARRTTGRRRADAGAGPQTQKTGRLFQTLNRKRRAWLGSVVANMIGEEPKERISSFSPSDTNTAATVSQETATIRDDIEEAGLIGGIANAHQKDRRQLSQPEAR